MLRQISWQTYLTGVTLLLSLYYLYVVIAFYRTETQLFIFRLTGKQRAPDVQTSSLVPVPEYEIMETALPDEIYTQPEDDLQFGPSENPDDVLSIEPNQEPTGPDTNTGLAGQFSQMLAEVKTLIRVINESTDTLEDFEMLFQLTVQKYPDLQGTPYQHRVTEYTLEEGADQLPFDISREELNACWKINNL